MESGIYKITSKLDGRVYIGCSRDINKRIYHHNWLLKNGSHHSNRLQLLYNKHGIDCIEYEIIELCNPEKLFEREEYWVNHYDSTNEHNGFNKISGGRHGGAAEEHYKYNHNKYTIYHYDGRIIRDKTLYELKKDYGIGHWIDRVFRGESQSCQGWSLNPYAKSDFYFESGNYVSGVTEQYFNEFYNVFDEKYFKSKEEYDNWNNKCVVISDEGEVLVNGCSTRHIEKKTGIKYGTVHRYAKKSPLNRRDTLHFKYLINKHRNKLVF